MKKRLADLEKMLKNQKQRRVIVISMYLVVAILVTFALIFKTTPSYELSPILESFRSVNNYNYNYTFAKTSNNELDLEYVYGKRFNEKRQLTYKNKVYKFESGKLIGFPMSDININKLEYKDLYELIKMSENTYRDSKREEYELDLNRFVKYMNEITIKSDKKINITVIYREDQINQIDLNLTNYVNLNENTYNRYSVSISYNRINQIIDF